MIKDSKTIKELSDRITRVALTRTEMTAREKARWAWAVGFLAGWLARIAAADITVRQQLEAWEHQTAKRDTRDQ